jgi:hypothetical protein
MAGDPKSRIQSPKSVFAWQGIRLELPHRWNPVKLEGDYHRGHALFADLHRPRLGLRWQRPKRRSFDPEKWSVQAMREEVGMLAAEEARPFEMPGDQWQGSRLYVEPDPPGRDVWFGHSGISGRGVQLVHHAHRREQVLAKQVLPTLQDLPLDQPTPWSVFELSCIVPGGMKLAQHQLNAGDLILRFTARRRELIVRQVAVAQLALKRLPLEKWLSQQAKVQRRHYRLVDKPQETVLAAHGGQELTGVHQAMVRRRRFFWARWIPPRLENYVLHDKVRDRLVLVQATDDEMAREVAATVGWAVT